MPALTSLGELRRGDLMFTNISKPLIASLIVKGGQLAMRERVRLGTLSIDHVGVVVEPAVPGLVPLGAEGLTVPNARGPLLVQAMPHGAETIELTPERYLSSSVAYSRPTEDYPGQADDAAFMARLFAELKIHYSPLSYVYLAEYRFAGRHGRGAAQAHLAKIINRRVPYGKPLVLPSGRTFDDYEVPEQMICSELGDEAWAATGKQVMPPGTPEQVVTPGALALRSWSMDWPWFHPDIL